MYLVRLGRGSWGEVLALAVSEGRCLVLDYLMGLDPSQKASMGKMMQLLTVHVPGQGPPKHNKKQSRLLEDKLFEFKVNQLRVLYFYDGGKIVVCTHGFSKKSQKTPPKEIQRAKDLRAKYLDESRRREIEVIDFGPEGE